MLSVYTSQYRYSGEDRLDITVKSGNKLFAPSWEMVMGHKNGTLSDEQYISMYYDKMRKSYKNNKKKWQELLDKEQVTVVCFCGKGKFCHRLFFADILVKLGAKYMGER